ncbi:hypothetical protein [Acidiphilium sp. PM]|uniref:hypothetical protein n=1 Tax=Acidiphilium sp. PM TaxID=1043206 RepID=UPI00021454C5|nr:hypothetical protein [Acidiphilium sp. PM]EGO96281.1 DNA primase [Acidiphilium sp. PM]
MSAVIMSRFGNRPLPPPKNRAYRPTGRLRRLPIETMPVEKASSRIGWILRQYMTAFSERQAEILAQRADKNRRGRIVRTPLPPMAAQITTGTGKTAAIRRMIPLAVEKGLGIAVVCRDHEQIGAYAESVPGLLHYHGRSPENPEKAQRDQQPWTCWKHGLVAGISEMHHLPQPTVCRSHCEHGMRRALDRLGGDIFNAEKNEKREKIKGWFKSHKIAEHEIKNIKPCMWLDHQEAALRAQVIGLPAQSFSDTMATWNRGFDNLERLVIIDESVPLGEQISVSLKSIAAWRDAAAERLPQLHAIQSPDLSDKDAAQLAAEIDGMSIAIEMCEALAGYLGDATGKGGTRAVPTWLRDQMKEIRNKTQGAWQGGTAPWEKPAWDGLTPKTVPYRAASAILHTLSHGGGFVADGELHVVALTQVGEWIADGNPGILLDATLPLETRSIIEAVGGHIEEIHVKQNITVKRYPNTLFGRGRSEAKSSKQEDHESRSISRIVEIANNIVDDILKENRAMRAIITHKPWREDIEQNENYTKKLISYSAEIGHFGLDDRAHDNWSGRHLAIIGGPILSPSGWRTEYSTARLTAIRAGADPEKWPHWPTGDDASEKNVWIDEGAGFDVKCHAPLPSDGHIRSWVLSRYRETIVQAIGRTRAVRHEGEPLTVEIWGGLPVDLSDFGIDEITYHDNPWRWTVDSYNEKEKEAADKRFEKVLLIILQSGRKPTQRLMQAEMRRLNMPAMSARAVLERLREYWKNILGVAALDEHRPAAPEPLPDPPPSLLPPPYRDIYREGEASFENVDQTKQQAGRDSHLAVSPEPERVEKPVEAEKPAGAEEFEGDESQWTDEKWNRFFDFIIHLDSPYDKNNKKISPAKNKNRRR